MRGRGKGDTRGDTKGGEDRLVESRAIRDSSGEKRDADKARSDRLFLYLPSVDLHKDQCRPFLRF